jgi:hypothetical protein
MVTMSNVITCQFFVDFQGFPQNISGKNPALAGVKKYTAGRNMPSGMR